MVHRIPLTDLLPLGNTVAMPVGPLNEVTEAWFTVNRGFGRTSVSFSATIGYHKTPADAAK